MEPAPRDLDALLAHANFARALARSLVRDPNRADDLVQRAWLAALRSPPGDGTPPRRWLAAVLRNFARQDARASSRRDRRERAVARPERGVGPDAVDDAAELQVRLITAVRELPEPYRSTLWARYYDGLAPREIAARDGVPVDSVKTRLARGLDLLRKRFDREHGGDRAAWMAAFLPLAAPQSLTASTIGVLWMGTQAKVVAAVVLACAAAVWVAVSNRETEPQPELAAVAPDVAPELERVEDPPPVVATELAPAARAPIAESAATAPSERLHDAKLRGRVLDLERRPVAGLAIRAGSDTSSTSLVSAADGSFAIRHELAGHTLRAVGPGWATVWVDRLPRVGVDRPLTILVARAGRLRGSVVDYQGRPVAGALIDVVARGDALRTLADILGADPHRIAHDAVSAADGRFDLREVPLVDGEIRATLDSRSAQPLRIPAESSDDLVIRFDAPAPDDVVVRGTVGTAPTVPVNGAYVRVGAATTRTDTEGRFEMIVRPSDPGADAVEVELVAASENKQPVRVSFRSYDDLARRARAGPFDLVLGADTLAISGRVVDSRGEPVVGARIFVDEEPFGVVRVGRPATPGQSNSSVEGIGRNSWEPVETQAQGEFSIAGLQTRGYRLVVTSTDPLAVRELAAVDAGTGELEVVLDTSGPTQRVAGRVVDGKGEPLANVNVVADVDLGGEYGRLTSRPASTNEAGAFELTGLRGRIVQVCADLETYRVGVRVERDTKLDDVRIVVPRRRAIQVDITAKPGLATDFQVRDARGTVGMDSSWTVVGRTVSRGSDRVASMLPIVDGRSDVVTVDDGDLTLVLLKHGQEVARVPLVLTAEGVTVVRP